MAKTDSINIVPVRVQNVNIRLIGDSPLIVHAWSEKAKRMMREAQMGIAKGKKKEAKSPVDDFVNSLYWLTDKPTYPDSADEDEKMAAFNKSCDDGARFCVPVSGIKQAAISAAYRSGYVKEKASLRGAFFIEANADGMVEVKSDRPIMREDMVRVGMGTADLRYRAELRNWSIDLTIQYNSNGLYSLENIINIINAGGFLCGICEWRPEKDGQFGQFHVEML